MRTALTAQRNAMASLDGVGLDVPHAGLLGRELRRRVGIVVPRPRLIREEVLGPVGVLVGEIRSLLGDALLRRSHAGLRHLVDGHPASTSALTSVRPAIHRPTCAPQRWQRRSERASRARAVSSSCLVDGVWSTRWKERSD